MQKLFSVRDGTPTHIAAIRQLLTRLADFELPPRREPSELWQGDGQLLEAWALGSLPEAMVKVAENEDGVVLGLAFAQMRAEALSGKPAAHLEVLAVSHQAEGQGVARALLAAIETAALERGAKALTLNVFVNNEKARGFYRHLGYDEELLRCIKDLGS